jgi:hypothetical protein
MRPKRPIGFEAATTLSDALCAKLLHGPHAQPPAGCSADDDERAYWTMLSAGEGTLWRRYEPMLRQRARDWGWDPLETEFPALPSRPMFYGEHFAAKPSHSRARDAASLNRPVTGR